MRLIDADAKEPYVLDGRYAVNTLVRCKDCIYYQDNNDGYPHDGCRWRADETPDATDFCSFGERKDDDGECGTCKHYDKGWDDAICDGCTVGNSRWERKDDE